MKFLKSIKEVPSLSNITDNITFEITMRSQIKYRTINNIDKLTTKQLKYLINNFQFIHTLTNITENILTKLKDKIAIINQKSISVAQIVIKFMQDIRVLLQILNLESTIRREEQC